MHHLVVVITQNDPDFSGYGADFANGGVAVKFMAKDPPLSTYNGGGENPLVLFGHANTKQFIWNVKEGRNSPTRYIDGLEVVNKLRGANLNTGTFKFCLLAGCETAGAQGGDSLFVTIAQLLGMPTIGSTTKVTFSQKGSFCSLTPDQGGEWLVSWPNKEGTTKLTDVKCADLNQKLANYFIRPLPA